jgi:hypothetical protein
MVFQRVVLDFSGLDIVGFSQNCFGFKRIGHCRFSQDGFGFLMDWIGFSQVV